MKYTLGHSISSNPYHASLVRLQLTRNLEALYEDIKDEVFQAFEDNIPTKANGEYCTSVTWCHLLKLCCISYSVLDTEWVSLDAMDAVLQIVTRTSNRVFVGLPLCMSTCCMRSGTDLLIGC